MTIFQQLSELMDAQYALWCWFLLGSGWQGSTWYPLLWIFPRIVTVALKWKTEGNRGGKEHRGYSLNWSWLLDGLKLFHERVMFMMDDITSDSNHSKYWKTFGSWSPVPMKDKLGCWRGGCVWDTVIFKEKQHNHAC